jgi:hypothetical protein
VLESEAPARTRDRREWGEAFFVFPPLIGEIGGAEIEVEAETDLRLLTLHACRLFLVLRRDREQAGGQALIWNVRKVRREKCQCAIVIIFSKTMTTMFQEMNCLPRLWEKRRKKETKHYNAVHS